MPSYINTHFKLLSESTFIFDDSIKTLNTPELRCLKGVKRMVKLKTKVAYRFIAVASE